MLGRFAGYLLIAASFGAVPYARAQENLESGKTPAQIFASDCSLCHKSPQGLAKGGPIFGLSGFLREHYTSSRESAAALSAYLQAMDQPAPGKPAPKRSAAKPPGDKAKAAADKKAGDKPAEAKPEPASAAAPKPDAPKMEAEKPEAKPPAEKPPEAKPAEGAAEKSN